MPDIDEPTGDRAGDDPSGQEATSASGSSAARPAEMIGDYRIIRKIGAGGMGVVYEAEQQHPKRLVALKVIHGGRYVDDQNVRLFEREAQALARLKHPGIAAIYESGRTPDGQHFFAMELVRGDTLKHYLEKSESGGARTPLRLRERLAIFQRIADAVTYAHQRGVIHRDLKPSNVIVEREFDAISSGSGPRTPGIKILDFGLARITETDLAAVTFGTEVGRIQGTLPYMSPEQVRGNPDEIDVRSDVYSLGVILYELIAGRRPYEVHNAMLHEAARIICETPPASLSKSWTGTKRLDRDLETIVEKALEKQVPRRYQSVAALGEDISRFLSGQPILARPPSAVYQLQKLVARHKVGFGFAASLAILVVVFAAVMSVQAERIARERDRANREAARANLEAAAAVQVADFLTGLFRTSDPAEARGRGVTAREMLDKGAASIGTELSRDPVLEARLLFTMGDVYRNLGARDRAEQLLERSLEIRRQTLGPEAPDTLRASSLLGAVYDSEGKTEIAEKTLTSTLEAERRVFGENHPDTLRTLANLANLYDSEGRYERSGPLMREVLERRRKVLGPEHIDTLGSEYNLAVAFYREHRLDEAERLLPEVAASFARAVGADHPKTLMAKDLLASVYIQTNRPGEARPILEEVYETRRRVLGPDHPDTLASQLGLGNLAQLERRFADAEKLYRETLARQERALGENHADALATRASLATLLSEVRRLGESERLWHDTLARMQRTLGTDHPDTANCLAGLAVVEVLRGRKEAAMELLRQAVRVNPPWGPKLAADPAFSPLKGNAEFQRLAASARP